MHEDRNFLKNLSAKSQFLNYELLEQIGAGGEGVVWSAVDLEHNRIVAIKLKQLSALEEQKMKDLMFANPMDKLLALRHPHILPIYDYGLTNDIYFLVSPYIPGGSLRDLLLVKELVLHDTLGFVAEIAGALDFLHEQNILHRDLKPSNILLDLSRNSYITDFGLARFLPNTTQELHTGRGTPPYAPPEQHAMKAMTNQSDIYSFGVMLFEMFTRRLPWDGEKVLGIQQLYSREELPDPCEINPQLPSSLVNVLRRMTDANPASRPESAGEAVRELFLVFGLDPPQLRFESSAGESENREIDAQELLKRSLMRWNPDGNTMLLSLTDFALIGMEHKQANAATPIDTQRYFLHNALVYGLDDEYWWNKIEDVALKMDVASYLINAENEGTSTRIVGHLLNDQRLTSSQEVLSGKIIESLIENVGSENSPLLRQQILQALRKLSPRSSAWQASVFGDQLDQTLAHLALNDTHQGDQVANLIGQIRSISAVNIVNRNATRDRRNPALLEIQKVAGSLPASVSAKTRLTISAELMLGRFIDRPFSLLAVFLMAYLGSVISVGIQNYLIVRIPSYMDAIRISVSLERGLFLGFFFGGGITIIRLIVERLSNLSALLRLAIATIIGGLIFSIGLFTYDILMVQIDLSGMLFLAGCMLAAFGFAQGSLMRPGILRMLATAGAVFLALALTWIIHLALLRSGVNLSPLFYYEYTWSPWQIGGTMLTFSLPISYFGNLLRLD